MAAQSKKSSRPSKPKPRKQHDVRGASLANMAKEARKRAHIIVTVPPANQEDQIAARSLREFAGILDREAKRVSKLR